MATGPIARRLTEVKRALTRNPWLRLLSLVLAIALWIFVNAGQHDAETQSQVPIDYINLPPGLVLLNPHPRFVRIEISGPRTLLSLVDPARLTLRLDLSWLGTGQATFKIDPGSFTVPRGTMVNRIVPSEVVLAVDRNVSRRVQIHLNVIGKPATGYQVAGVVLSPPQVQVFGPSRYTRALKQVETAPFQIGGASSDIERPVGLVNPSDQLKLGLARVTGTVKLAPAIADRQFEKLPIQVHGGAYRYAMAPREAAVTVRGPELKLGSLDLSNAVSIEAGEVAPGVYDLPVTVSLPDGFEVVRQTPRKVRLQVMRASSAAARRARAGGGFIDGYAK